MQRKCLDLEDEIRGLLKVFGVKLPIRLGGGAFDEAIRGALLPILEATQLLLKTVLELDRWVRKSANQDAITTRFMCSRRRIYCGPEL